MANIKSKIKKGVYESKKARDILDEEFTEFLPIKRNINEFFNIYIQKFYDISIKLHNLFVSKSLEYIIDYINPKEIVIQTLEEQIINVQEDIDSIELFHPIFPNGSILKLKGYSAKWLIQSGKKRKIETDALYKQIKVIQFQHGKPDDDFWIEMDGGFSGIPNSKPIKTTLDITDPISVINTYTGPY